MRASHVQLPRFMACFPLAITGLYRGDLLGRCAGCPHSLAF